MTSLTFFGAASQVTGSCYLLETDSSRILLDCGLVQGSRETEKQNEAAFPFDPAGIDAAVLWWKSSHCLAIDPIRQSQVGWAHAFCAHAEQANPKR